MIITSLDKWIKGPPKKKKPPAKKPPKVKEVEERVEEETKKEEKTLGKLQKFKLKCPDKKCKYEKIKVKSKLSEQDIICPKCSKEMKIAKL